MDAKCIIIDDDDLDRIMLQSFVKRTPGLELLGSYASAREAMPALESGEVQVLLLDIDMPEMNGLDLRREFPEIPVCIFATSHPEHAVESFETSAFDFLVKPVKYPRFEMSIHRAMDYLQLIQRASLLESVTGEGMIMIREGKFDVRVQVADIVCLEALGNYTRLKLRDNSHYMLSTLGNLLRDDTFSNFVRVHRSFAIQKFFVSKFNTREVEMYDKTVIPVGRAYKTNLNLFK